MVTRCSVEARHKPATGYLWLRLTPETPLYANDTIQTGPQGFVTVKLTDETIIRLDENSMIVLDETLANHADAARHTPLIISIPPGENHVVEADANGQPTLRDLKELPNTPRRSRHVASMPTESVRNGSHKPRNARVHR
jgi:hypothetical protein